MDAEDTFPALNIRRVRLEAMLEAMKQQLAGKVGNAGNNAFKLRKLFKMWDTDGSGQVHPTSSMHPLHDSHSACLPSSYEARTVTILDPSPMELSVISLSMFQYCVCSMYFL